MNDFRTIVETHQERTYRAAFRILRNREDALDVAQDAFLKLYMKGGGVPDDRMGPWLVRVATNRALDRIRRGRRQEAWAERDEADPAPGPMESVAQREDRTRIVAALAWLSDRQREVVALRVMEQMTFVEISATLSISEGAAKVYFRRGLQALRNRMLPQAEKPGRDHYGRA